MRLTIFSLLMLLWFCVGCQTATPLSATPNPAPSKTASPHIATPLALNPTPSNTPSKKVTNTPTATPTKRPPITPTLTPLPPREVAFISHGDRTQPYVALTFDAGESPDYPASYDEAIVRILLDTETPATIFVGGLWAQRYKPQTQALAAHPLFEIGNHSWSHPDFVQLSPATIHQEIIQTQQIVARLTGTQPTLFRFPFGSYNEPALELVAENGLLTIQWDVVSGDPDPLISAKDMVTHIMAEVQPGSIIVMHMNGRGWHTAEALPTLIRKLREEGYTLVTVSQLLNIE
ncbi:MAG: polysaccharide deacetylase family protein [Chloroflexota bacterium]